MNSSIRNAWIAYLLWTVVVYTKVVQQTADIPMIKAVLDKPDDLDNIRFLARYNMFLGFMFHVVTSCLLGWRSPGQNAAWLGRKLLVDIVIGVLICSQLPSTTDKFVLQTRNPDSLWILFRLNMLFGFLLHIMTTAVQGWHVGEPDVSLKQQIVFNIATAILITSGISFSVGLPYVFLALLTYRDYYNMDPQPQQQQQQQQHQHQQ